MEQIPEKIGRYEVLEIIGEGGMGVVYKARDPNIGRLVALKVMKPSLAADHEAAQMFRERFEREAGAAGVLQHPNIVSVYDADEDDGAPFIAMEYVEGRALDDVLEEKGGPLPDKAASIVAQVARGLAFAHESGVIHRDIKPGNIIITDDGAAKVMDFGIARTRESDLTKTGTVLGSPNYMSPEQITGQDVDHRSDVFSLGVVLYQLLTGEKPFLGENQTSISYRVVRIDPVKPSKINPVIDPLYDHVVAKALAKRPEDRYRSAIELADDLEGVAEGRGLKEEPPESTRIVAAGPDARVLGAALPPDKVMPVREFLKSALDKVKGQASALLEKKEARPAMAAAALIISVIALVVIFTGGDGSYDKIEKYIEAGKHEKAAAALIELTEENPNDHRAFYLLGAQSAAAGDFNASVRAYSSALALNPEYKEDASPVEMLLRAPEGEEADLAVSYIVSEWGKAAYKKLKAALKDPDYNTHWNAASALEELGYRVNVLDLLVMDLNNEDCEMRKAAVEKMAELGSRSALPELEAAREKSWDDDSCMGDSIEVAMDKLSKVKSGGSTRKQPLKKFKEGLDKIFKKN
jgi:serine/threonine-protein kinase